MPPKRPKAPQQDGLFEIHEVPEEPPEPNRRETSSGRAPWTGTKALLIERYLHYFTMVTRHGAYIDGFAGPQREEQEESWAAEMVLKTEPPWLNKFFLVDEDAQKFAQLQALRRRHMTRRRQIRIYHGDFNEAIAEILHPRLIRPRTASFCLIDQRSFECKWATVKRIAAHPKARWKIELFYFLANSWYGRGAAGSTTEQGQQRIADWWGRPDWPMLRVLSGYRRAELFIGRFKEELGYASAIPYAIKGPDRKTIFYWMIHATDHPAAPELMDRAYEVASANEEPSHVEDVPLWRGRA